MPLCKVETNASFNEQTKIAICAKLSKTLAELTGKPETYVMVLLVDNTAISFGGSTDPAALVECKSIGLSQPQCKTFSQALCAFLEQEMGISATRTYIEFTDLDRRFFGWNSSTFG